MPFQQESPEGSSLVGGVRGSTNALVTAPQPYLTPYNFPFSTQLRLLARFNVDGADYYYTCSASQASDFHLLTAAHCIYSHDPKGDGSGAGAGFAAEIWAWSAGTDIVDPIDPDNWPDFPYGIAKVTFQSTYSSWINNLDLNWDVAFLTLDRRLGDNTGWMGREWGTTATSLNFGGYPSEKTYVPANNPYPYLGYDANNVVGYTCCHIEMNALVYGGQAGGGVWRFDPADGSRSLEGVNSTAGLSGHAEAALMNSQIEADLESIVARDMAAHAPADLPEVIEYVQDDNSKSLVDTSVTPGSTFRLTLNAFNAGYSSAGDITAGVYLTKDPNNVASGIFLQNLDLGDLDAYSYTVQTQEVSVPATVAPGQYYVGYLLSGANRQYGTDRNDVVIAAKQITIRLWQAPLESLQVQPAAVVGGQTATGTVTLATPAPATGIIVHLSTTHSDVVHIPATVVVQAGHLSATFLITTSSVPCATDSIITATSEGPGESAPLTVYPEPVPPIAVLFTPSSVTGGTSTKGEVVLEYPAPCGGEIIKLHSPDPAMHVPPEIVVPGFASSATFAAQTTPVGKDTFAQVVAADQIPTDPKAAGFVDVKAPVITDIVLIPHSVVGGNGSTGTVTISGPAPAGGLVIMLTAAKSDANVTFPDGATVTVPQGMDMAKFKVMTGVVKMEVKVKITGTDPAKNQKAEILNVVATLKLISVTIVAPIKNPGKPDSVVGGGENRALGKVTLNAAAPADTTVSLKVDKSEFVKIQADTTVGAGFDSALFSIRAIKVVTEDVTVTVTGTLNKVDKTAALTIVPLVPVMLALDSGGKAVVGGQPAPATVTMNGFATAPDPTKPDKGVIVTLGSDNAAAKVTNVEVKPGMKTGSFSIETKAVTEPTDVVITATFNGVTVKLPITISPVALTAFTIDPTPVTGGTTSKGTITIDPKAPKGGIFVNVSSDNAAAKPIMKVPIAAGGTKMTFNITTTAVKTDTVVTLTATYGGFVQKATLTILAPKLSAVTAPATVKGGANLKITVTLDGPAPAGGIPVGLTSSDPSIPILGGTTVMVKAGDTSATFTVKTKAPAVNNTKVTITASYNKVDKTTIVTVTK